MKEDVTARIHETHRLSVEFEAEVYPGDEMEGVPATFVAVELTRWNNVRMDDSFEVKDLSAVTPSSITFDRNEAQALWAALGRALQWGNYDK